MSNRYGYTCVDKFAFGGSCSNEPGGRTQAEADSAAASAGWVIGHRDGQAYYACPAHAHQLFDPIPLERRPQP